jgi:hypothetical protein
MASNSFFSATRTAMACSAAVPTIATSTTPMKIEHPATALRVDA